MCISRRRDKGAFGSRYFAALSSPHCRSKLSSNTASRGKGLTSNNRKHSHPVVSSHLWWLRWMPVALPPLWNCFGTGDMDPRDGDQHSVDQVLPLVSLIAR